MIIGALLVLPVDVPNVHWYLRIVCKPRFNIVTLVIEILQLRVYVGRALAHEH